MAESPASAFSPNFLWTATFYCIFNRPSPASADSKNPQIPFRSCLFRTLAFRRKWPKIWRLFATTIRVAWILHWLNFCSRILPQKVKNPEKNWKKAKNLTQKVIKKCFRKIKAGSLVSKVEFKLVKGYSSIRYVPVITVSGSYGSIRYFEFCNEIFCFNQLFHLFRVKINQIKANDAIFHNFLTFKFLK